MVGKLYSSTVHFRVFLLQITLKELLSLKSLIAYLSLFLFGPMEFQLSNRHSPHPINEDYIDEVTGFHLKSFNSKGIMRRARLSGGQSQSKLSNFRKTFSSKSNICQFTAVLQMFYAKWGWLSNIDFFVASLALIDTP